MGSNDIPWGLYEQSEYDSPLFNWAMCLCACSTETLGAMKSSEGSISRACARSPTFFQAEVFSLLFNLSNIGAMMPA